LINGPQNNINIQKPVQSFSHAKNLNPSEQQIYDSYNKVAESMETQFAELMFKEMRKTVPKEEQDSTAMNFYNSTLDHERAKILSAHQNGLGIKNLILDQILPPNLKQKRDNQVHNNSSIIKKQNEEITMRNNPQMFRRNNDLSAFKQKIKEGISLKDN